MRLGTCYFPEHWDPSEHQRDVDLMVQARLDIVRMGEFAWSRIERESGQFDFDWMDRTLDRMHSAGLEVCLCTPTATPPKWLVDRYPEILPVGPDRQLRDFGSRRHYRFASTVYREQSERITEIVAARWGQHPAVTTWQTDNEYGCHDTTFSYAPDDLRAFKDWCAARYGTPQALNRAWGNAFWSQEITDFDQLWLPVGAVTEINPACALAWRRFGSDQVVDFNRSQVELLRRHSPGRRVAHNFMGFFTEFDHHRVAADLDIAAWDSYPLGFTDMSPLPLAQKLEYMRTGHPDIAGFHHDLYRGMGELWVMEQQPGPVNWAPHNPAPLPGMEHFWIWEAWAHGADVVSFFRWRQAPWAQEQMHAGMLRPDGQPDAAFYAAQRAAQERDQWFPNGVPANVQAPVALVLDYESLWAQEIQPQGASWNPLWEAMRWYRAARESGLSLDIVGPGAELSGYALVLCPASAIVDQARVDQLAGAGGRVVLGPRSASKTPELSIPEGLAPGVMAQLMPIKVVRVGSYRSEWSMGCELPQARVVRWREQIETALTPLACAEDGAGLWYRNGLVDYVAAALDDDGLRRFIADRACEQGLNIEALAPGERVRLRGGMRWHANSGLAPVDGAHGPLSQGQFSITP